MEQVNTGDIQAGIGCSCNGACMERCVVLDASDLASFSFRQFCKQTAVAAADIED